MDDLDRAIIAHLRRFGRASVSDMALTLDVTRATVRSRMERLQESGEIIGFTVVLKNDVEDMPVRGTTLVQISGKGKDRIIRQLEGLSAVQAIHTTNGRWDLVTELGARTLAELDDALNRIRSFEGVENSETHLFLATKRTSRARAFDPSQD